MYPLLSGDVAFVLDGLATARPRVFRDVRTRFHGINHGEMLPGVIEMDGSLVARVIDLDVVRCDGFDTYYCALHCLFLTGLSTPP